MQDGITGNGSTATSGLSYPAATWRLIIGGENDDAAGGAADGATNMAVDQAILISVREGTSLPTLRFYGWSPPCLSLGRNQPLDNVDWEACRAGGVDVVRRPTGGRAILHVDELTYSIALLDTDPRAAGGVLASYRRLSEGLLSGLDRLGVVATQAVGQRKSVADLTAICFDIPSDYEITVRQPGASSNGGRKLVGSAQWRARGGVLQHGSLPLQGDIARIVGYLALPDSEREAQRQALRARATTLEESRGDVIPFRHAAQVMAEGFSQALNLTFTPGTLTAQEQGLAETLRRERYANQDWTTRT
jgi:lipoate-protein ligase A